MKIIDIRLQIKNKGRVNIYLDDQYYCGLDMYTTTKYRIKVGDDISREEVIKIQRESEYEKGFNYSLSHIEKCIKTQSK